VRHARVGEDGGARPGIFPDGRVPDAIERPRRHCRGTGVASRRVWSEILARDVTAAALRVSQRGQPLVLFRPHPEQLELGEEVEYPPGHVLANQLGVPGAQARRLELLPHRLFTRDGHGEGQDGVCHAERHDHETDIICVDGRACPPRREMLEEIVPRRLEGRFPVRAGRRHHPQDVTYVVGRTDRLGTRAA
jgi:hypothetical protein